MMPPAPFLAVAPPTCFPRGRTEHP